MAPTDNHDESTPATAAGTPAETVGSTGRELATVHPLRAPESTGDAIEGEVVSDEEWALITSQRAQAAWRYRQYRDNAVTVARVTRTAVTHDRTKRTGKFLLRNAVAYPVAGAGVVVKRWRDTHGATRYERMMRQAEHDGNHDRLLEWEARDVAEKQRRHDRVMDWVKSPLELAKAAAVYSAGAVALLLVLGFILWIADKGSVLGPIEAIVDAIAFCVWFVVSYGVFLLVGGTTAVLVYLWNLGRTRSEPAGWFAPPQPRGEVVNITPSIVVAALRDLGIKALRDAIKGDADYGARMLGPITRYGPGAQVEVTLPPQVTSTHVMNMREMLAGNLDRKKHEVQFERSADSERQFTLWVADSGALDRKLPDSPLLDPEFGPVDVYRDTMPWGVDVKGDPVELNLLQQHLLLCGLSKQGKTAAARGLVLWLMLDPSARLMLADLKGFGDWSMFEGLAETLIEGAGAENFIATCDMLEAAVAEMADRYERWRAMGRKGDIGRADSLPGSGFEPLFVVVDEVQKLYGCSVEHPDGGDIGGNGKKSRAARAAQALHDQARAVNIHLLQYSQNPTNANLPAIVREGAMIRASLYVGTESISRMALGEAAVDTGAAPHALRAGLDRGTVVLAPGESMDLPNGSTHTTVRTHFISTEQAYGIADRAKALRQGAAPRAIDSAQRDLLDDLAAVLGEHKVPAGEAVALLRDHAPGWAPYRHLGRTELVNLLDREHGIAVPSTGNKWPIDPVTVRDAIAARALGGGDADA